MKIDPSFNRNLDRKLAAASADDRLQAVIATMDVGIKALAAMPKKSVKRGEGTADIPVTFAGVTFTPGAWLYADRDGIVVCAQEAKG